jgi:hypothetical protein
MRAFRLGVIILLMLPCVGAFVLLTPPQYAQCEGLEPDECLDMPGTLRNLTRDLSHLNRVSVAYLTPDLPGFSKPIPFLRSSTGSLPSASPREVTLTSVLLI